jgi:hypothetical protein
MYAATPTGGQHAKELQEKQALASFRSCFLMQPTTRFYANDYHQMMFTP